MLHLSQAKPFIRNVFVLFYYHFENKFPIVKIVYKLSVHVDWRVELFKDMADKGCSVTTSV